MDHNGGIDVSRHVTRRDFLKGTVAGTAAIALYGSPLLAADNKGAKSVVAIARSQTVLNQAFEVDKATATQIVRDAVISAAGAKTYEEAWKKLFKQSDMVGIVTSTAVNPTHPEVVDIVKSDLMAAGVPEANICFPQRDIPMVTRCTALIALPALKAHWLTGIGTVMKLYIMYSAKPPDYHNENSSKLGEIWQLDCVKGKTRLVLIDALRPLCDKGPQVDPRYLWNYNGIIASVDPVAAEAVGLKIIQTKRDEIKGEPWPLSPPPLCVEAADKQYHLGASDLSKIRIVKSGWGEWVLV